MRFRTIEVDFDVHKKIELARRSFSETPNDVLRKLLGLGEARPRDADTGSEPEKAAGRPWSARGVVLPHGTRVRMGYNRRLYKGVIDDGEWLVDGQRYHSPSAAAGGVAKTKDGTSPSLNGWIYWEALLPSTREWVPLKQMLPSEAA